MHRKTACGIYLGNLLDHFDTALYAFLAPLFATLFFPKEDYITALIITYAYIPISKIAKPIGALFFGHIGDNWGRSRALTLSLFGVAGSTLLIGCLPTFETAGYLAPILLLIARTLQSFAASGETIGAAVYFLEKIDEAKKDFYSGLFSTSTIAGILMATTIITSLYQMEVIKETWRFLYFFGAKTALIAYFLRKKSTPDQTLTPITFSHRLQDLWKMREKVAIVTLAAGFSHATYSMAFILMTGFIPLVTHQTEADVMRDNNPLLLLDFMLLPFFGWIGRHISRERLMGCAALCIGLLALPLFTLIDFSNAFTLRAFIVTAGVAFSATFHSWSQGVVPRGHRYSLISFSYTLGSQLIGGTTAAFSLWIYKVTNIPSSICWYFGALALFTSYILLRLEGREEYPLSKTA